jgi:DNA polymerase III alpha subunit (gram-positive type)
MRLLCYDLETNGFHPSILQFAFIGFDSKKRERIQLTEYVNPGEALDRRGAEVHGISSVQLAGMKPFDFYKSDIMSLLQGSVLIGFNNHTFDDPKLARQLGITIDELNETLWYNLDIMRLCQRNNINGNLESVTERFSLQNPMPHNANGDVGVTLRLLHRLLIEESIELPEEIGISKVNFMEMIEKSVDLEDESYLIIESEPAQMYTSLLEENVVQFGPHAGITMDELRLIDEHLWRQLNGN